MLASAPIALAFGLALAAPVALASSAPIVDSFTSTRTSVAPGETVVLALLAHDPDCVSAPCTACGTYIRQDLTTFTSSGGVLGTPDVGAAGSPYTASVSWTAPTAEGTYSVTASVSDSGGMMCAGRGTATATVDLGVSATPLPVVDSFTASPTSVVPGGSSFLGVTAHDPLGRPVSVSFSAAGGSVVPTAPGATTALFTAPQAVGPVALTVTVTPAGGSPASATLSILVVAGLYEGLLPNGGSGVTRLTALADGRVATVDAAGGRACVLDPASGAVSWSAVSLSVPVAIAQSGARYFVLERGARRISVLDDSGRRIRSIPSPAAVGTDLVAGPGAGELSVSETAANRIWVVSATSGNVLRSVGDGTLLQPTGLASFDGKLAVADTGNGRVLVFDATGTATTTITDAAGFVRPQGLAWDAARQRLTIADVFTGQVFLVGLDGTVAGSFGGFGSAAGQLTNPSDLDVLSSGLVAVSSAGGGQVKLFRVAPAPGSPLQAALLPAGSSSTATSTVPPAAPPAAPPATRVAPPLLAAVRGERLWIVPGMAFTPGANGTRWVSELNLHNPDAARTLELSLAFVDGRPGAAGAPEWKSVSVAPGELVRFPNVLSSLFGLPSGAFGALLARAAGDTPLPIVSGRSYNDQGEKGTFGQGLPGVAIERGLLSPNAVTGTNVLAGLRENAEGRTNLMLVNAGGLAARVSVRLIDAQGQPLGESVEVAVEPFRMVQLSRVLSAPAPGGAGVAGPVDSFRAVVTLLEGSGIYPYATVVDNASGDPVLVTPADRPSAALRLAALVRTGGANGTVWRSDLVLANPGTTTRRLRLSYSYTSSGDGHSARQLREEVATLNPGETIEARDFAAVWLGLPAGATTSVLDPLLDVAPAADDPSPGEPVLAFARVYDDQPSGRVGLQLTPVTPGDGIDSLASASGTRLVLSGLESDAAYRTNVVLYLASADASGFASGTLRVIDGEGRTLKSIPFALDQATRPTLQVNDAELFEGVAADTSRVTLSVEGIAGTAPVASYATVVDQISGDATCQAAQLAGDGK